MAISQSITVLPTPPSRADPDNFDARADAFLGALPTMQSQMNTWAGQANTTAAEIGIVSEGLLSVTPAANKVPLADGDGELALGWLDLTGYAPAANGVTNGDSHDHNGGDGAQIAYSALSGLPALGKVLQVVGGASSPGSNVSIATDTWTDIGLAAAITPSASSSKILVIAHAQMESLNASVSVGHGAVAQLLRGSTVIQAMPYAPFFHVGTSDSTGNVAFAFLDSPATTSATTYKIQAKPWNHTTSEIYIDTTMVNYLVLLEIGA
jgi:hypothetical protein